MADRRSLADELAAWFASFRRPEWREIAIAEDVMFQLQQRVQPASPAATMFGVPVHIDPTLGPGEWKLVPHDEGPRGAAALVPDLLRTKESV